MFAILADRLQAPLLLTYDNGLLLMANLPGAGITRFPEGTTPDAEHRDRWLPFRLDPHG